MLAVARYAHMQVAAVAKLAATAALLQPPIIAMSGINVRHLEEK